MKDAEWKRGRQSNSKVMSELEMRKIKNIVENISVYEALEHILDNA